MQRTTHTHIVVAYNAVRRQRTCKVPMTAAQEYGWHALKPRPPHHPHHVNHTDVTKGEGRTASTYYGYFVVGQ